MRLRTVDFAGFRIRTVYVLSPYYIRTVYADSADICALIWSADRVRTPWTEYEGWRRQYGESTEPVRNDFIRSIRSIRET